MAKEKRAKKKRDYTGHKWVFIALAVIFLVSVLYLAVRGQMSTGFNRAAITNDFLENPQPDNITSFIKNKYAKRYTVVTGEGARNLQDGQMSYGLRHQYPPLYKAEGYNFYTNYQGGSNLQFTVGPDNGNNEVLPRPIDTQMRDDVVAALNAFGLKKTGDASGDYDTGLYQHIYVGKGLVCEATPPDYPYGTTGADVACGEIAAYSDAAADAKPFVDAMIAARKANKETAIEVTDKMFLINIEIDYANSNGYTTAKASTGNVNQEGSASTLFYRKDEGEWKFFRRTQMGIQCPAYNTVELRQAYKGETCYDPVKKVEALVQ